MIHDPFPSIVEEGYFNNGAKTDFNDHVLRIIDNQKHFNESTARHIARPIPQDVDDVACTNHLLKLAHLAIDARRANYAEFQQLITTYNRILVELSQINRKRWQLTLNQSTPF